MLHDNILAFIYQAGLEFRQKIYLSDGQVDLQKKKS